MSQYDQQQPVSGWATGGLLFAATLMFIIGMFQAIAGLVAIFDDGFYLVTENYVFDLDVTAWGWIHLLLGLLLVVTGWALFARKPWAGVVGITLASLSAIANFFFIPYYPWWSLLVISLAIWVIWSLTRPGALEP